ncbi:aldehyde dehydrogenase family protein, partial [Marinobacter sp. 1Y8]
MIKQYMSAMGVQEEHYQNGDFEINTPIDGTVIGKVTLDSVAEVNTKIQNAKTAFQAWRTVPAPKRGELIRLLGEVLREHKEDLGFLVSLEAGKIKEEGLGEVQEMIDICDFA